MPSISICGDGWSVGMILFRYTFTITIMLIGHSVARERATLALSSSCLFGGTRLSWLELRWASVVKLGWETMECVIQGESSHPGSIRTAKNGLLVVVEHARACRTEFRRYLASNSGTTRHDHVHR